jgi:hypothetical protein
MPATVNEGTALHVRIETSGGTVILDSGRNAARPRGTDRVHAFYALADAFVALAAETDHPRTSRTMSG